MLVRSRRDVHEELRLEAAQVESAARAARCALAVRVGESTKARAVPCVIRALGLPWIEPRTAACAATPPPALPPRRRLCCDSRLPALWWLGTLARCAGGWRCTALLLCCTVLLLCCTVLLLCCTVLLLCCTVLLLCCTVLLL